MKESPAVPAARRIDELRRKRPRSTFFRISLVMMTCLVAWAWLAKSPFSSVLSPEQKRANFERFVKKLTPDPVRESGNWSLFFPWASKKLTDGRGLVAVGQTFALAALSITLAGFFALFTLPAAARNLSSNRPLEIAAGKGTLPAFVWQSLSWMTRAFFVITRSIPEYVLGFLLISVFGPDPWALVLALAIHNWGILGRLGTEVVENAPPVAGQTVIAHGGGRTAAYLAALLPESFNRMIVYLFYRWETCVREATVLGMLGVISLGYLVVQAKSGRAFDDMIFFVLLGAILVLLGDLTSALVRRWLRFGA